MQSFRASAPSQKPCGRSLVQFLGAQGNGLPERCSLLCGRYDRDRSEAVLASGGKLSIPAGCCRKCGDDAIVESFRSRRRDLVRPTAVRQCESRHGVVRHRVVDVARAPLSPWMLRLVLENGMTNESWKVASAPLENRIVPARVSSTPTVSLARVATNAVTSVTSS